MDKYSLHILLGLVISHYHKMSRRVPCGRHSTNVTLKDDQFGLLADETTGKSKPVWKFTWTNRTRTKVEVITYGATITSIKTADKNGTFQDIVMGFRDMEGYLDPLNPYFGATIGRVANRIGHSKITLEGTTYELSSNLKPHQLHGGFKGFDKVNWDYYIHGKQVVLSYHSADKEEGFPGDVIVNVTFQLTDNNEFWIDFKAFSTKPTFVNLTNHSYFNLAGHNKGADELYKHVISINADQMTETDENSIPTGKILPVEGTNHDLRIPRALGEAIDKTPDKIGYNDNFCITVGENQGNAFVARVHHPPSGRVMEVYSDQPGVQFYTANYLPECGKGCGAEKLIGKDGYYFKHGALCLETQNYPDAINHTNFPKAILTPGETYSHTVAYKFSVLG